MGVETGRNLGHYRLLERLGQGGMGVVWRALDTRLGREVAIKLLPEDVERDPERLAALESEARAVAAIDHPGIVTIHAIEEADGRAFLAMELVHGEPLSARIVEGGLDPGSLLAVAVPLVAAVAAAHDRGITHRDLKPGNVMVGPDGRVKVLDFGIARRRPARTAGLGEATTEPLDLEGPASGTLGYMAPEQIRGLPTDPRADVFSLGVLLYEMATGFRPFAGDTAPELVAAVLRDAPRPPHEVNRRIPPGLGRLVVRCLEKDPDRRFPSARELGTELEAVGRRVEAGRGEPPSVAVLPFRDLSPERDQGYFCEGMAEEILNALGRLRGLRVASRSSSFLLAGASLDGNEIAGRLGVRALLEGSVRKSGGRVRITVALVDPADGVELWSERYDRDLEDVFAIQDEIAQRVAAAFALGLSPSERRALKQVATADVRAYDYYLRGRQFFYQYRRRGVEFAIQMFSRAIELDPSYALAWAGIADSSAYLYMNAEHDDRHRERADQASLRALDLDPDVAECWVARAVALSLADRADEAASAFREAIRLNPNLFEAHYFYARECFIRGRREEAVERYRHAIDVRPEDYQAPLLLGQILDDLGRAEDAAAARRAGVEAAERRLDLNPDDVRALYMGANGLVSLGVRERGLEWAERALRLEPDEPMLLYNLACIQALAGEAERAVEFLERSLALGFAHRPWIENDSDLDAIRSHPRYAALVSGGEGRSGTEVSPRGER